MRAIVVSIGDELVLGQTVDTNAAWLSARLAEIGVEVRWHLTVPDDREAIRAAFAEAADAAPLVLVTGGLGPTDDDLTRHALADLLHQQLLLDADALALIEAHFARLGRPMNERNRVQAMRPDSASIIPNPAGTAPGLLATYNHASIFIMPGVPREMRTMYDQHIKPQVRNLLAAGGEAGRAILTATLHTFGMGESDVAAKLGDDLTARDRNPTVGTTVANGIVSIRIRSAADSAEAARDALERTVETVQQRLGPIVFGRDGVMLEQAVVEQLIARGETVATAESCTAGLLGKMLTDPPGSSAAYLGGYVVYCNEAKQRDLGVPADMLETHGAVSEPVARALADACRERTDATYALAITGIAGPGGGSAAKPVGTVWIALAHVGHPTTAHHHVFPGDRAAIRDRSAKMALNMLRLQMA